MVSLTWILIVYAAWIRILLAQFWLNRDLLYLPECCDFNTDPPSHTCGQNISNLTKIHAIFMTHLDVGYTEPMHNSCDRHFNHDFPKSFEISKNLSKKEDNFKFRWTEYPWMILEYLDGGAQCGYTNRTLESILQMNKSILNDEIIWNANAFTSHWSISDPLSFNFSIHLRNKLNKIYNKNWGKVFKSTDVPGLPLSIIPYLNKSGIYAAHIGTNFIMDKYPLIMPNISAKLKTILPKQESYLFRWKHSETGLETIIMMETNYGSFILPNNSTEAMVFFYNADNYGPPTIHSIDLFKNCLTSSFPNVEIITSSMDEYVENVILKPEIYDNIPVFTDLSMGNSWIYAVQSDPFKISAYKYVTNIFEELINNNTININDIEYEYYMRRLLKVVEHNGGIGRGITHPDWNNGYKNLWFPRPHWDKFEHTLVNSSMLKQYLNTKEWRYNTVPYYEKEWDIEQQFCYPQNVSFDSNYYELFNHFIDYFDNVLLPNDVLPSLLSDTNIIEINKLMQCGHWQFIINQNGTFIYLYNNKTKFIYATNNHSFGQLSYETYNAINLYAINNIGSGSRCPPWDKHCIYDTNNPNYETNKPKRRIWSYHIINSSFYIINDFGVKCNIQMNLQIDNKQEYIARNTYGAPKYFQIDLTMNEFHFDYEIIWINKPPSYTLESILFGFHLPINNNDTNIVMNVLGYDINPKLYFNNSWKRVYGMNGVKLISKNNSYFVNISKLDSGLVIFGDIENLLANQNNAFNDNFNDYNKMYISFYNNWWFQSYKLWNKQNGISKLSISFNQKHSLLEYDNYNTNILFAQWDIIILSCVLSILLLLFVLIFIYIFKKYTIIKCMNKEQTIQLTNDMENINLMKCKRVYVDGESNVLKIPQTVSDDESLGFLSMQSHAI